MLTKKDVVAAEYFYRYIGLVKEDDMMKALKKNSKEFKKFIGNIPKKKTGYAYAEGKWTLRQVLQHIIDAERVFACRALWFARKDQSPLPGFDENNWAAQAPADRKWNDLVREFKAVRKGTELLFGSMSEEALGSVGTAGNNPANPLALGFICCGHTAHHMKIIKERYL